MFKFLKDLFGLGKKAETSVEVPYKLEPTVQPNPVTNTDRVETPSVTVTNIEIKEVEAKQDTPSVAVIAASVKPKKSTARKTLKSSKAKEVDIEPTTTKVKKPRVVKVKKT